MPTSKSWIWKIKKGDVLKWPNGTLRIVRHVSQYEKFGRKHCNVTFAIRHCSWTHRPHTVLNNHDLAYMGVRPTKARVRLNKKIDKAIEHDFSGRYLGKRADGSGWWAPVIGADCVTHCCDVVGKVN